MSQFAVVEEAPAPAIEDDFGELQVSFTVKSPSN